jgi:hypothetical protein
VRPENGQKDLFREAPIWYEGLTGRRRLFVELYCTNRECFLNATAAFIKAYTKNGKELSDSSIQSNASRIMRDPRIKRAIGKLLRSRQNEEDQITEFQLLDILKRLSFYDPGDLYKEDGTLKQIKDMGDLAICVTEIKRTRHGREIKLYDRTKSIAILCDYLDVTRPAEGAVIVNPNVYLSDKEVTQMKDDEGKHVPQTEAEDAEYEVVDA